MIEHVYRRALEARSLSRVIVATDDLRVFETVRAFGGEAVMTSVHHRTGSERVAEVAAGLRDELVVNVQGDEPLISPALVSRVAEALAQRPAASLATACHPIDEEGLLDNPNVVKVVLDREGYALYFSRSRIPYPRDPQASPVYRHAGLYAYRAGFLAAFAGLEESPLERAEALEQLRALWHGYRIAVAVSEMALAPGVDTPQDLEAVRTMFSCA